MPELELDCLHSNGQWQNIASIICKYWRTRYQIENRLDKFKVAFIVPTRNLVEQQARVFEKAFYADELQEIGEKCNEHKIKMYFKDSNQKLINTLNKSLLSMNDLSILIFDECHHTNDSHPYNELMSIYFKQKVSSKHSPLILGLTASQGIGKVSSALFHLIKLCANMDSKAVSCIDNSVDLAELEKCIPSPLQDEIILVEYNKNYQGLIDTVFQIALAIFKMASIDRVL